jgi:hypothetical protein
MSCFENALEIYCEKPFTRTADEWWDEWKSEGATKITVEWKETWGNDQGESCELLFEMKVNTLKKASNLVGAFLLGLKTHKDFPKKDVELYELHGCIEYAGDFEDHGVPSDFRLVSTQVKRLDENSDVAY